MRIDIHYARKIEKVIEFIQGCAAPKKLVFCESRRMVEAIGKGLRDLRVPSHVIHSSLSQESRKQTEQAFQSAPAGVIVATSALELGVDTSTLETVIQVGAPCTVANLKQRMGRGGRRPGMSPHFVFLCYTARDLERAAALTLLMSEGWVEQLPLPQNCLGMLSQQILVQLAGARPCQMRDLYKAVRHAGPFRKISERQCQILIDHMVGQDILKMEGRCLTLGKIGKQRFTGRNLHRLLSVFETPKEFVVLNDLCEIGELDPFFVAGKEPGRFRFILGARTWLATDICWKQRIVHATPARCDGQTVWRGGRRWLSFEVCQAVRRVLSEEPSLPWLAPSGRMELNTVRSRFGFISLNGNSMPPDRKNYRIVTFAGGAINSLIAHTLKTIVHRPVIGSDYEIIIPKSKGDAGFVVSALQELRRSGRPNKADVRRFCTSVAPAFRSKFSICLADALEAECLAEVLVDLPMTRKVIKLPLYNGEAKRVL